MHKDKLFIAEDRDLAVREIDLIQWLLTGTNNLEFIEQIEKTRVITRCDCGCRTIDLKVEGYKPRSVGVNLSAQGFSPEGVPVDVVLHVRHGLLSELEIYAMDGTEKFSLPEVDRLNIS